MTQWLLSLKESALVRLLRWLDAALPRDDLLRQSTYRRLWTSILISSFGGQVTMLALPLTAAVLLNASPRATHAQAALRETVRTMSARLIDEACISLPLLGSGLDADGIAADPALRRAILDMLQCIRSFS